MWLGLRDFKRTTRLQPCLSIFQFFNLLAATANLLKLFINEILILSYYKQLDPMKYVNSLSIASKYWTYMYDMIYFFRKSLDLLSILFSKEFSAGVENTGLNINTRSTTRTSSFQTNLKRKSLAPSPRHRPKL